MKFFLYLYRESHWNGIKILRYFWDLSRFSTSSKRNKISSRTQTRSQKNLKRFSITRERYFVRLNISSMWLQTRMESRNLTGSRRKTWGRLWSSKNISTRWIICLWKQDSSNISTNFRNASNISSSRRTWNRNHWIPDEFQHSSLERIAKITNIDDEQRQSSTPASRQQLKKLSS